MVVMMMMMMMMTLLNESMLIRCFSFTLYSVHTLPGYLVSACHTNCFLLLSIFKGARLK